MVTVRAGTVFVPVSLESVNLPIPPAPAAPDVTAPAGDRPAGASCRAQPSGQVLRYSWIARPLGPGQMNGS